MSGNNIDFDSIRRQIDIVNVISSYIPLSATGRNFKGICPFHNDSNPSMMISPDKQIYKCFSCGASGNVFTFIMNYEKISFIEAVKKACDIQGISIPEIKDVQKVKPVENKNSRLVKLMEEVNEFYHYQLLINSQSEANKYLESRFLGKEIVDEFRIGFCPVDGTSSIKYLLNKGYNAVEIIEAGVGVETADGKLLDRQRGRLTFPLHDTNGRVVAFSGRRINDTLEQKYLNTPETTLFHKSDVLYNFHRAEKVARQQGFVYIVEGFMDAISLYRVGIQSVVATMGTAFTKEHIKHLSSLRVQIRLLFDCDSAGQKAAFKTLDMLNDVKLPIKVVKKWADGKDSDEVLNTQGKEVLLSYINNLYSPLEFRIDYLKSYFNFDVHDERKQFAARAASYVAVSNLDLMDIEHYVNLISSESGFSKELIKTYVNEYKRKLSSQQNSNVVVSERVKNRNQIKYLNRYELATRMMIKQMIDDPVSIIPEYESSDVFVDNMVYQTVINYIVSKFYSTGTVEYADLFNDLPTDISNTLTEIYDTDYVTKEPLSVLLKILNDEYLQHLKIKEIAEEAYETNDKEKKLELAKKIMEDLKKKDSLKRKDLKK